MGRRAEAMMLTIAVEELLLRGSMPRSSSISDPTDHHFLPPPCRCVAVALPSVTAKDETTGSLFGLACLGFLASRFPRFSPLDMSLSLAPLEPDGVISDGSGTVRLKGGRNPTAGRP